MAREEKSGVERLKNKLYARNNTPDDISVRSPLSPSDADAPRAWSEVGPGAGEKAEATGAPVTSAPVQRPLIAPERKPGMSFAAKFLLGSMGFFVIAAGVASYVFFGGANVTSPQNIDIEIVAPSLVDGGKETQFEIVIRNRNATDLELADLVLRYPPGTRSVVNQTEEMVQERQTIGVIKSGEQVKRTVRALFYGEEGEQKNITATLEYSVANSNAVFERSGQIQFLIGSAPVSLSVETPKEAVSGQPFPVKVVIRSNSTSVVEDVVVKGEYPFGFSVVSSDPKADAGGMWRLGTLQPGQSRTINVTGAIDGSDGDERVFRFIAGSNSDDTDPNVKVPYLTIPKSITITRPFIGASIAIAGQTGKTVPVSPASVVSGTVTWQNNFADPVTDVELSLAFSGPAIVPGSILGSGGFYQSSNNSVIWSKDQNSNLETVAPGSTGSFQFSFKTKEPGEGGTLITNPTIDMTLSVRAVRASGAIEVINSAATARASIASALTLGTEVLHFSGPFSNTGPMPPRVESKTTYTVRWTVKNSSNAVANGVVKASLPQYVRFVAAQSGSGITYNEGSRTVTWSLGDIKAGTGYTGTARSGAFQVEIEPSTSQVGQTPVLVNSATLSGQDRFAQVQLGAQSEVATINLVGDSQGDSGMDIVAPKQ